MNRPRHAGRFSERTRSSRSRERRLARRRSPAGSPGGTSLVLGEDAVERAARLGEDLARPPPAAPRCRRASPAASAMPTCISSWPSSRTPSGTPSPASCHGRARAARGSPRRARGRRRSARRRCRRRVPRRGSRPSSASSWNAGYTEPGLGRQAPLAPLLDLLHHLVAVARLLLEQEQDRRADVAAPHPAAARAGRRARDADLEELAAGAEAAGRAAGPGPGAPHDKSISSVHITICIRYIGICQDCRRVGAGRPHVSWLR